MLNFFKLKTESQKDTAQVTFQISGMHCTSCGMNIDGELEESAGVLSAQTSYAKSETKVEYDPQQTSPRELQNVIESLNYQVTQTK